MTPEQKLREEFLKGFAHLEINGVWERQKELIADYWLTKRREEKEALKAEIGKEIKDLQNTTGNVMADSYWNSALKKILALLTD